MNDQILNCRYALDGKSLGRSCSKIEDRSCRFWGNLCWFDEQDKRNVLVNFYDDDGYPD